ncbi:MAG: magnesium transporter [Kofleriaceae bacterium]
MSADDHDQAQGAPVPAAGDDRRADDHPGAPHPDDHTDDVPRFDPASAADITHEIREIAEARADDGWAVEDDDGPDVAERRAAPDDEPLAVDELRDAWAVLDTEERVDGLHLLPREDGEDFFLGLLGPDQAELLLAMRRGERRSWMRLLEPDDVADVVQAAPEDARLALLALLDGPTRKEVEALLAYEEDDAGGLMNTRYARLRPNMTTDEAVLYLRRQARAQLETIYYAYVLDPDQHLLGVVSFRDLFAAGPNQRVAEFMETDVVSADPELDQEALSRLFAEHDLTVMPIVDSAGVMKGIVTVDDIVDVVQEEATEDAQKFGGMEALDMPYLQSRRREMLRKRGGWLAVLLIGEMLTATALAFFEHEIAHATVLALFIPLIISSGGNAGSQASTLVIRAMALGEVRAADWWRVMRRELTIGLALGAGLGVLAMARVLIWGAAGSYGTHYALIGATVAFSVVGVVTFGTFVGAMLPFILRRIGADPASASAPFVATLVDVTGLIIYFLLATLILSGTLL